MSADCSGTMQSLHLKCVRMRQDVSDVVRENLSKDKKVRKGSDC